MQEDVQMLLRSIPAMRELLPNLNLIDLLVLTNQVGINVNRMQSCYFVDYTIKSCPNFSSVLVFVITWPTQLALSYKGICLYSMKINAAILSYKQVINDSCKY